MRVLVRTLALGLAATAAVMAAGEPTAAQSKRPTIAVLASSTARFSSGGRERGTSEGASPT